LKEPASDGAVLMRIRELASALSDERSRAVLVNVVGALELNPQPLPPGIVRIVLEAIALNPQPLPPAEGGEVQEIDRDMPSIPPAVLRTVLEAIALNPRPLPQVSTGPR